jgi:hypothetical protein
MKDFNCEILSTYKADAVLYAILSSVVFVTKVLTIDYFSEHPLLQEAFSLYQKNILNILEVMMKKWKSGEVKI